MLKPIALIGFYGCGKTELARRVAAALHMPCSDLYAEIENRSGMRIASLYDKMGEAVFRKFESLALSALAASGGVVATSGGCVMLPYNRRVLIDSFTTFYLDAPFEQILTRLETTVHPTIQGLTKDELFKLYEMRKPLYEQTADHTLDTTLPVDQLETQIIDLALTEV